LKYPTRHCLLIVKAANNHPTIMPDTQIEGAMLSASPAPVVDSAGNICVFHQGAGDDGTMWYCKLSGGSWQNDIQVPKTSMSASPAPVLFHGKIYVFHQGARSDGNL
jgi:hypothetical protein